MRKNALQTFAVAVLTMILTAAVPCGEAFAESDVKQHSLDDLTMWLIYSHFVDPSLHPEVGGADGINNR